jgi:ADP-ribosylglycohydrolase
MWGAIAGDVIGSVYEHHSARDLGFELFHPRSRPTDDTVLTVATAAALLDGVDYASAYRDFARRYPRAGYGGRFRAWFEGDDPRPYQSWGNGSAMRVSPIAWAFESEAEVLREAERSAVVTHDSEEGIRGAQAAALAVFLARQGAGREEIRARVSAHSGYDLQRTIESIRPRYGFDVSCQGSVPEAIIAFLDGHDFESAVRLAIYLRGDADTQACIAGSIAEASHGVPEAIRAEVEARLPDDLLEVTERFTQRFVLPRQR